MAVRSIPGREGRAMKRRVEVTNKEGNPIYLNPDYIVWVRPVRGEADGPSKVQMVAGELIDVQETVGEVLKRIDQANRE
jgi:hypothetical protein